MSWWVQSEAVIGFFNAFQLTNDPKYLALTMNVVDYIRNYVSDHSDGKFGNGSPEETWMPRTETTNSGKRLERSLPQRTHVHGVD